MNNRLIFSSVLIMLCLSLQAQIKGTYAIQNVSTGKNLRPYEAGKHDGNRLVLYNHVEWKCMTWDFTRVEGSAYQLKNLFTSKTFQPAGEAKEGCTLEQKAIVPGNTSQQWEFISAGDDSYNIRLKGTQLYITAPENGKTNDDIVLRPKKNQDLQLWKLVSQNPSF